MLGDVTDATLTRTSATNAVSKCHVGRTRSGDRSHRLTGRRKGARNLARNSVTASMLELLVMLRPDLLDLSGERLRHIHIHRFRKEKGNDNHVREFAFELMGLA